MKNLEKLPSLLKQTRVGENVIYRGHADHSWELKPSIGRHFEGQWSAVLEKEIKALEEFKKRSIPYLKHPPKSDIEWLCLMQHHGCATRLLDFTTNPLIALFFASDPAHRKDGSFIIAEYNRAYENVSNEKLFERKHSFAYHPPHITERIIGQSGCFVYSNRPNNPLNEKQIEIIKINKRDKFRIRSELSSLGVTYSSLFPGMDGVCKDLNDALVFDLEIENLPF